MLRCTGNLQAEEGDGYVERSRTPSPRGGGQTDSPPVISSRVSNTWSCSGLSGAMPEEGSLEGSGGVSGARKALATPSPPSQMPLLKAYQLGCSHAKTEA